MSEYSTSAILRENYIELHTILTEEIESNGFRNEHEAISFISSMFSHVMSEDFLTELSDISSELYLKKSLAKTITKLQRMLSLLEKDTKSSSLGLGVDKKFISVFYAKNKEAKEILFECISEINLDSISSESRARRALFKCILSYLKNSIKDSKSTYYLEVNSFKAYLSLTAIAFLLGLGYYLFYSKTHFLVWLK
jgi:hypothetical protein